MKTIYPRRISVRSAFLLCLISAAAGCVGFSSVFNYTDELPDLSRAGYIGTDACAVCHKDEHARFVKTGHARPVKKSSSFHVRGCEACHGPGSMHAEGGGDPAAIYRFNRLSAQRASEICLGCHPMEKTSDWHASPHLLAGVGCAGCHAAHPAAKEDPGQLQGPELCFYCHREKKAAMLLPSRHPVNEGKMYCATCHDSHGAEQKILKKSSVNDLCLECHAEYQGPFVHEHPPVTEDCLICHEPHGTIENNLLRQGEPFLCLRCHRAHKNDPDAGEFPTNRALLTSCSQCHAEVHGTDLPARHSRGDLPQ